MFSFIFSVLFVIFGNVPLEEMCNREIPSCFTWEKRPNCQSSASFPSPGQVCVAPESIRKLKSVGPKQSYLSGEWVFVSPPMRRTFGTNDPAPLCQQWTVTPTIPKLQPSGTPGGPRAPLWAVTFVPEWNFDIFYLDDVMCFFIPLGRSVQLQPQFYTWPAQILFQFFYCDSIHVRWTHTKLYALIPNSFYKYMFQK